MAPEEISEIYCCAGDPGDIDIEALWKDAGKEMLSLKTSNPQ